MEAMVAVFVGTTAYLLVWQNQTTNQEYCPINNCFWNEGLITNDWLGFWTVKEFSSECEITYFDTLLHANEDLGAGQKNLIALKIAFHKKLSAQI